MLWYVIKLLLMLPLLAGLIWGSLWVAKRLQARMNPAGRARTTRLIETTLLAPGVKLAVVEFHGREILIGSTRHGLTRLAEAPARPISSETQHG